MVHTKKIWLICDTHLSASSYDFQFLFSLHYDWLEDSRRKDREGKKIGRKVIYFSYLVVEKNWVEKVEQCPKFHGPHMNSAKILSLCYWAENCGEWGWFSLFPFLPSFPRLREMGDEMMRGARARVHNTSKVLHSPSPLLSFFFF